MQMAVIWVEVVVLLGIKLFCPQYIPQSENIEYTKLVEWGTNSDRKAVINAVRRLTATALLELRRQIDSQLMQPGTGVIGTVTG